MKLVGERAKIVLVCYILGRYGDMMGEIGAHVFSLFSHLFLTFFST